MYEGIKILNGGQEVNLAALQKSVDGELILEGISTLSINLNNGASYNENVEIMENNSDVKISLIDSQGNEIFIILRGLGEMLLTNNPDVPLFEVFQAGELQASMSTIDDLEAAAAGGELSSAQDGDGTGAGLIDGTSSPDLAEGIRSLDAGELVPLPPLEGNTIPVVLDVFTEENEAKDGVDTFTGQLEVVDPDLEDTGLHIFEYVDGTLVVTSSSGVVTEIEDGVSLSVNPDGSYEIIGDFNDLAAGETATISFQYTATDAQGATSTPATLTLTVNGTNDQPVVEDIDINTGWLINATTTPEINGEDIGEDTYDVIGDSIENINALFAIGEGSVTIESLVDNLNSSGANIDLIGVDGSALKLTVNVEAGETVTFDWLFRDAEGDGSGYNDFAFVVIDGQEINLLALVEDEGSINSGRFTYTFESAGEHEITFGTVNDEDTVVDSSLEVTYISGGTVVSTQSVGYVEDTVTTLYETFDSVDNIGEDDTQDEARNFYSGALSVVDDDDTDTHIFTIVDNSLVIDGPVDSEENPVINAEDISVSTVQNEDGSWDYIIDGDFSALSAGEVVTISFQYYADDQRGFGDSGDATNEASYSTPATITLTITGTNDQPIVENVNIVVDESHDSTDVIGEDDTKEDVLTTFNSTVSLSASDEDVNDTHTFNLVDATVRVDGVLSEDVKVEVNSDGSYSVSGDFNYLASGESATVTFQYTATDSSSGSEENNTSEPKTVTLVIDGTNDQPVVENVNLNGVGEDSVVLYETHDAIDNIGEDDTQDEPNNIFEGQLTVTDDDNNDTHTFFLASDGVVVTNTPLDSEDNPVITTDDISVTINPNGSYTIDGDFSALAAGETATVTVEYYAVDSSSGSEEKNESEHKLITFTITGTNDQPIVQNVDAGRINESHDSTDVIGEDDTKEDVLTTFNSTVSLSASDEDVNDTHTFNLVDDTVRVDGVLSEDVTVIVNSDGSYSVSGDFNYLASGESATVTFQYTATDSSSGSEENNTSEPKTVTLVIDGTNDQPIVQNVDAGRIDETHDSTDEIGEDDTKEDVLTTFNSTVPLTASDDDDSDIHTFNLVNNSIKVNGVLSEDVTVVVNSDGSYSVSGDFNYLASGESATVTFQYTATDSSSGSEENNTSEPKTVTLIVDGTNDQPVVDNVDAGRINESHDSSDVIGEDDTKEDVLTTFNSTVSLSASDEDVNDTHTFNLVDDTVRVDGVLSEDVTVIVNSDGSYSVSGDFNYLASGESATVTFQYTATDSSSGSEENNTSEPKTVTLVIDGTNDQPVVAANKLYTAIEADGDQVPTIVDETTTIRRTFEVTDDDVSDTHEFHIASITQQNEIQQGYELFGPITYIDTDGIISSIHVQVKLPLGVDANDISIDSIKVIGNEFEIIGKFDALNGALGEDPADILDIKFKYYADDLNGFDGSDGQNESSISETRWITVQVEGTNDVPTIIVGDSPSAMQEDNFVEDGKLSTSGRLDITDFDAGQSYFNDTSEVFKSGTDGLNLGGTFDIGSDGNWTYEVDNSHPSIQSLGDNEYIEQTYTVTSLDGTVNHDITVRIWGENDAPVANDDTYTNAEDDALTTKEDTPLIIASSVLLVNDTDAENDPLTITDVEMVNPLNGTVSIDSSGNIIFTPAPDFFGEVQFKYTVSDGDLEDEGLVTVNVTPVNDAPVANDDANSVTEEGVGVPASANLTGNLLLNDTDIDSTDLDVNNIKFNISEDDIFDLSGYLELHGTYGVLKVNEDGDYIYDLEDSWASTQALTGGQVVTEEFEYTIDDGAGGEDTAKLVITITGTNDAPIITVGEDGLVFDVDENSTFGTSVGDVDSTDVDGASPIYSFVDENGDDIIHDKFNINPTTGEITVKGDLDYETEDQYTLKVKVIDQNGGEDIEDVTINVNNLIENIPPEVQDAVYDIVENSANGAVVGTVVATDDVDEVADTLTYSFVDANGTPVTHPKFEINSTTGEITLRSDLLSTDGLDYETMGTDKFYMVKVGVDDGTDMTIKDFKINILDLDEDITQESVIIQEAGQGENSFHQGQYKGVTIDSEFISMGEQLTANLSLIENGNGGDYSFYVYRVPNTDTANSPWHNSFTGTLVDSSIDLIENTVNNGSYDATFTFNVPADFDKDNETLQFWADSSAGSYDFPGFTIESSALNDILNLEAVDPDGDDIDMVRLLSDAQDFDPDGVPTSLDEIDMTAGNHILSNITVADVISMTDSDNTLIIEGDSADKIELDMSQWEVDTSTGDSYNGANNPTDVDGDADGYVTYTNVNGSDVVQLLINEDIDVKLV